MKDVARMLAAIHAQEDKGTALQKATAIAEKIRSMVDQCCPFPVKHRRCTSILDLEWVARHTAVKAVKLRNKLAKDY